MSKVITYFGSRLPPADEFNICRNLMAELDVEIKSSKHILEIIPLLSDPNFVTDYVVFDVDELYALNNVDVHDMVRTLSTIINCTVYRDKKSSRPVRRQTKIIAMLSENTNYAVFKELLAMPEISNFTLMPGAKVDYKSIRNCVVNYLTNSERPPRVITELLKPKKPEQKKLDSFKLTPRQKQIYDIISTRGSSNKHISKILNISESTVKLHVGAILKKYGVRNRTQLAVFSKQHDQTGVQP
jgi:DNA-binding CsgD family transcriptional regulator